MVIPLAGIKRCQRRVCVCVAGLNFLVHILQRPIGNLLPESCSTKRKTGVILVFILMAVIPTPSPEMSAVGLLSGAVSLSGVFCCGRGSVGFARTVLLYLKAVLFPKEMVWHNG